MTVENMERKELGELWLLPLHGSGGSFACYGLSFWIIGVMCPFSISTEYISSRRFTGIEGYGCW